MDAKSPIPAPRVGMMFTHRHWVDYEQKPMVFTVTALRRGGVYYAVVDRHDDGTRWLKHREYCTMDRWTHVCAGIVEPVAKLPGEIERREVIPGGLTIIKVDFSKVSA